MRVFQEWKERYGNAREELSARGRNSHEMKETSYSDGANNRRQHSFAHVDSFFPRSFDSERYRCWNWDVSCFLICESEQQKKKNGTSDPADFIPKVSLTRRNDFLWSFLFSVVDDDRWGKAAVSFASPG